MLSVSQLLIARIDSPLLFSVASTVSIPNFSTQTPSIQGGGTMFNTTFNMTININNPNLFDLNLERIDITVSLVLIPVFSEYILILLFAIVGIASQRLASQWKGFL